MGVDDQQEGGIIHCEKGYDEFGLGQVEFERPMEFLFLLFYLIGI